ncbi:MAG: MFS transporter, partial [Oligoflexia bacterium]|nr:MFS transporter [Oligoflexia bacterium]
MKKLAYIYLQYADLYRTSSRELWIVFFARVMEALAYFVTIMVMVLFFSTDLGMNDLEAGKIFGIWTLTAGLLSFFMGAVCDVMGIRLSLVLGFFTLVFGRLIFAILPNYYAVVLVGLPLLALGSSLLMSMKSAAVKQYTTRKSRGLAFGIYYALMNIGALFAGLCLDRLTSITRIFGEKAQEGSVIQKGHDVTRYVVNLFGVLDISTYQMVFLFGFLTTLAAFIAVLVFIRKGQYAEDDIEAVTRKSKTPLRNLVRSLSRKSFWHFMVFLLLMSLVKLLFTHVHITIPKFMLREIGQGAAIGRVYSINGFMLVVLPPLISPLLNKFNIYKTIIFGAFISSLAPLFLAVDYSLYIPIGNFLGVHHVYVPLVLFFVFLSLGEAVWSPKLYEYTANIAPRGEETTYVAWAYMPWILAKPLAGILSGYLLMTYCPETGPRNSEIMWMVIFITTIAAPVVLLAASKIFKINQDIL